MKVLQLAGARVLLWARERNEEPFEVSKIVSYPVQPRCPSAPRCPGEAPETPFENRRPAWVDPTQPPAGRCPYAFEVRGECLQHRNQVALELALFRPGEVPLTRSLLEAVGYSVEEESIDPTQEPSRILRAHGHVGPNHQVRLFRSPSAGSIVLVRELCASSRRSRRRLRVLPAGGGR